MGLASSCSRLASWVALVQGVPVFKQRLRATGVFVFVSLLIAGNALAQWGSGMEGRRGGMGQGRNGTDSRQEAEQFDTKIQTIVVKEVGR